MQPTARRPVTWWWFLIPLLTFGMGTFVMVLVAGTKLRSRLTVLGAFFYAALLPLPCIGAALGEPERNTPWDLLIVLPILVIWLIGTCHVIALSVRVHQSAPEAAPRHSQAPTFTQPAIDPAIQRAQLRRARRVEARALLANDPGLAAELNIGRPDLPDRQYDDGGLVDVNHVPPEILAGQLDLPVELARTITTERDRIGGFGGADELIVYCAGVTPERLDRIRERLLFVPL